MKRQLKGSLNKPRLYVFKSNKHIYAQIIDDHNHKILASSSTLSEKINKFSNCEIAEKIGKNIGIKLKNQGIQEIIFDRGKNIYHGQIKALANATRKEGIQF
uniref:Large ribosomal subunit protein uL18c n=1 Tax=Thuretia quercifolia TaxID=189650 RepID=A0A1Z1ML60_9FLOR|nr:ribosomal protein L18 [Thuretia quercifolia]ARW66474.1 ribosomal protein L18 [Thuretia quercifolia]